MCVVKDPPVVYEPASQVEHSVAPAVFEYLLSCPQRSHVCCPGLENFPAVHRTGSGDPLQILPAGHTVHFVRLFCVPPLVNDPGGQILQDFAPSSLNTLSLPHASQIALPLELEVPAGQIAFSPEPTQLYPGGQARQ